MSLLSTIGSASARAFGFTRSAVTTVTDAFFKQVTLLLNTTNNVTGQNNTFIDSTGINSITRTGNATQGTFSPFSQTGWSNHISTINGYVSFPSNAAYGVGTGDFTVEFFLFPTAAIGNAKPFTIGSSGAEQIAVTMTSTSIRFDIAASQVFNISFTTTANSWNHFAFVRSGTDVSLYANGNLITTETSSGSVAANNALFGGIDWSSGLGLIGYYSNVRYSNTARYSGSTITVPTAPFVSDANTLLLTAQSNRFLNTGSGVGVATTSLASVQAFSPFTPSVPYSTTTNGGSLFLDGSSDLLTVANNSSLQLDDGAFTINLWFYRKQTGANSILGKGTSNTGYLLSINTSNQFVYTDGSTTTTSTATVPLNAWTYLSVVRSGRDPGQVAVYVNAGTPVTGTSISIFTGSEPLYIGANRSGSNAINAFMSGIEIYKGVAITPTLPTAPPTYVPSTNQSLVMNFTNFNVYDATGKNNLETAGTAQVSDTRAKFGTTALVCSTTGNIVQIVDDSPNLQMANGDFTIEGWFNLNSVGSSQGILSKGATTSTGWSVNITSGNRIQFSYSGTNLPGTVTTLTTNTWYYFAVVRSGTATGNIKIYLGTTGATTLEATSGTAVTTDFNQTNTMYVGALRTGASALNGYLEEVRITKGVARTITTVPTAAFPIQ
jgi:hypothetical protein